MADRIKKEEFKENSRGKKPNQKLKPYLVLKFLEKYSDEEHTFDGEAIANAMIEDYGIFAEKRSIYRDIKDINKDYSELKPFCYPVDTKALHLCKFIFHTRNGKGRGKTRRRLQRSSQQIF